MESWPNVVHSSPLSESVDSLCRDDADMPKPPYKRKACNLPNVAFVSLFREIIVILESHSTHAATLIQ